MPMDKDKGHHERVAQTQAQTRNAGYREHAHYDLTNPASKAAYERAQANVAERGGKTVAYYRDRATDVTLWIKDKK